jgi:lauroyl/myristoyl acyltransferase
MNVETQTGRNGILRHIADVVLPPVAWLMCRTLGLLTWTFTSRGDDAVRNLAHAFPERSAAWHRRIAFQSVTRMFEMFSTPLFMPWMSDRALCKRFSLAPSTDEKLAKIISDGPCILLSPHSAMFESMSMMPLLHKGINFTSVYRPLDFKPADRYVLWARSNWGLKFISRKESLLGVRHVISRGENLGILFDQNALTAGALILSFGRICSTTDLPAILATKLHLRTYIVLARRKGFMRASFDAMEVGSDGTIADLTVRTSLMLENILRNDEGACADWMWAHRRWKSPLCRVPHTLSIARKKSFLDASLHAEGLSALPRLNPFCLRLPDDPALARIAAGWMERLREARPDVRWVVLAPKHSAELFTEGGNCERLIAFEPGGSRAALRIVREEWPEFYLSLEPSADNRADAERCRAFRSIGLTLSGSKGGKGHDLFPIPPERTQADAFDKLLDDLFKACGMGMAAD